MELRKDNKERIVLTREDCKFLHAYFTKAVYLPPMNYNEEGKMGHALMLKIEDALNWIIQDKDES